eukprot:362057-Chlamydomonas_euryale.AAC.11
MEQGLPVQGASAAAAQISGQWINYTQPVNSRTSRKVVPPPEPSSWHPKLQSCTSQKNRKCSCVADTQTGYATSASCSTCIRAAAQT